jgi:GntR family transcriptional regulator
MTDTTNHTALPIYLQISESLMRDIASGQFIEGERLPPERELAKTYGTTVRTLRKSLAELEKNGMLERVQGSGNYVRNNADARSVYSMFRLELPTGGGLPTATILSVDHMPKPDDLPTFGTSKAASRIRRLRFLDSHPIAIEEIWLDADSGAVNPATLSDSLYLFYKQKLGFWISRAVDSVWAAPVPDWTPDGFTLGAGQTAGYIERFSWAQKPEAVEFSRTWFDTDQARYVQRLK